MENGQVLLAASAAAMLLLGLAASGSRKRKARKERDFQRRLETLLLPRETVNVICHQKGSRCILTSNRIIFEKKGSFSAFPIKSVTKVQGINEKGNRTTVPGNMKMVTLQIDREYRICNTGPEFAEFVTRLSDRVKKQSKK